MKRLSFLMITAALLCGCGAPTGTPDYRQISMDEAVELLAKDSGYILLDVRTQSEYDSGHIPGAICLPNESIGGEAPAQLPDKNQTIYVYCRSGNRSKQASAKLAALGYTNVVEFGGINSWPGEVER